MLFQAKCTSISQVGSNHRLTYIAKSKRGLGAHCSNRKQKNITPKISLYNTGNKIHRNDNFKCSLPFSCSSQFYIYRIYIHVCVFRSILFYICLCFCSYIQNCIKQDKGFRSTPGSILWTLLLDILIAMCELSIKSHFIVIL